LPETEGSSGEKFRPANKKGPEKLIGGFQLTNDPQGGGGIEEIKKGKWGQTRVSPPERGGIRNNSSGLKVCAREKKKRIKTEKSKKWLYSIVEVMKTSTESNLSSSWEGGEVSCHHGG